MQPGYIVLIVGAALLISGIVVSTLWAVPFASKILREDTILGGVSVKPASSASASTEVIDTSRPISLAIHVERNNVTAAVGQIPSNNLRETVRNPNGIIMTSKEFTGGFFTTFKPDIPGKYTVTIYNLGHTPVSVGVLVGNLPFVGSNNHVNLNSFSGIIIGAILSIIGIIVLIAGGIVVALDRRKTTTTTITHITSPSSSSETTGTETVVLAKWTDRFIAWLIDFIIVSIGLAILFAVISIPFWIAFPQWLESSSNNMNMHFRNVGPFNYLISSLVFTAYWTYFESTSGQSIGKKVLHLKTTDARGKNIDVKTAVLESFGKAFLLPLDIILEWIFTNDKRQRIFNQASNTIVIKLKEGNLVSNNVTYIKD